MVKHLNITVSGNVQGVGFRFSAQELAQKLSITGFIQNMPDGSVYIEAEGSKANLEKFITWCKQGSPLSKVDDVKISSGPIKNFPQFTVS